MTRSELYALVWTHASLTLAPRLDISTCGLAKTCARHNIPKPSRGYWAKLAAGLKPLRTPLPEQAADEVIPRFRALDANGAPAPRSADEWVIPGILRTLRRAEEASVAGKPELLVAPVVEPAPVPVPAVGAQRAPILGNSQDVPAGRSRVSPRYRAAWRPTITLSAQRQLS